MYAFSADFQLNKGGNVRIYVTFRCLRVTIVAVEKHNYYIFCGVHGGVVVKALRYNPTGRGFDSRWCHWNFSVT